MIMLTLFRPLAVAALLVAAVPAMPHLALAQGPVAMAFADSTIVPVDVTTIEVVNADTSPTTYPYVGSRAPIPYDQAMRAWAAQRFTATGASVNSMRVTLKRGAITEKLLPISKGISGWFKKEQNAEYTGALEVDVAIVGPDGKTIAVADGKSWASETVREDATSTDREAAWMSVIKKTFDNMDQELIPRLRQTMVTYVH